MAGLARDPERVLWLRVVRAGKKHHRKTETRDLEVGKRLLKKFRLELDEAEGADAKKGAKKDGWGAECQKWLEGKRARPDLSPVTLRFYGLVAREVAGMAPEGAGPREVTRERVRAWWQALAGGKSPMFANTCLGAAREIFAGQIERGLRLVDPSEGLKKMRVAQRRMRLPEAETFRAVVAEIEAADSRWKTGSSRFVRFLAFSGLRISEARQITWEDFEGSGESMQMVVRGAKGRGVAAKFRRVPVIPPLADLLSEMRADLDRAGIAAKGPLWFIQTPRFALQNACRRLGVHHIRVHDLRHLFATQCIESGVDIPTVARWLGHSDGGALAMRTYGHLRDEHSLAAARRVRF